MCSTECLLVQHPRTVWLQGSLYGYSGMEMDNLQTLVSSTNELADTLRAVRLPAARLPILVTASHMQRVSSVRQGTVRISVLRQGRRLCRSIACTCS